MIENLAAHSAGKNEFEKYLTDASNARGIAEKIYFPQNIEKLDLP